MRMISLVALGLAGCGKAPPAPVASEAVDSLPSEEASSAPTPNYAEHRKGVYYYIAAVSENDQKDGHSAGKALGFKYLGKNAEGDYVLGVVDDSGKVLAKATCADPCRVIHDFGQTYEYNPKSVIGSAFQDAMNGLLEVDKRK